MRRLQSWLLNKIVCSPWIQKKVKNEGTAYIIEMLTRVIARNPKFTNVAIWLTLGTFSLIGMVCKVLTPTKISVFWDNNINIALGAFATGVTAFGQTVVQPEIKGLDDKGNVVKQDVAATRPFTAIAEATKAMQIGKANAEASHQ